MALYGQVPPSFYETRAEGEVGNQTRNGISQGPEERCLAAQLSEHVVISNCLGSKVFDFWPVSALSVLLDLQFRNTQTTAPVMHLKYMICAWLFARAMFLPS